ncbi:ankyrin repeat family protein [Orientia tsutsugamushi str. Gilliam]|uniref:Ankyrin repeat family protein n=1 Tax=Orientia tsutsugamushi str. Gilliam TaxID=1359184 RepID=A0A0F3MEH8_ORITS|nr:ankyrin repeat domain-containing protein [Orientia tsutsugamushi]KJV54056.1 ankyrin repeat family protein [Orientia tsutsugamushi str. Gilliam]SPR09185.1 ankyrin repeat-containing protein 13 [Orientia tsutsugamushi str. Gilliam]
MNTALSLAIKRGDVKAVLDILNTNPGLVNFQQDGDFKTPLHISVENKQSEITKVLLERNANVTLQDNDGNTPLHFAARNHDLKTTEILLSYGNAIIDMQNNNRQTPLHLASTRPRTYQGPSDLLSTESLKIAQALLTHGANVNLEDENGNTALHYATNSFHHLEITEILLNHGANVNAQNNLGDTALHHAAKNGLLPTVVCLLKSGANVHLKGENGNSVLHCAAQGRCPNESIVKAVLHHGADVNARNNDGSTPLHHAAEKIHDPLPAIQILLKHGADIDAHDNRNCTPLNNAISSSLIINMQTEVPEFLTAYITKLEYSSDKKTNSAGSITNQQLIQQSPTLSEYKLACEKELKELSNIKVGGGQKNMLSAFLANTTDDNESSRYVDDPKVQEIYERCEEKFHIYSGELKKHIDEGRTRKQLLYGAVESMDDICEEQPREHSTESNVSWNVIPPEVKLNILKHLSNEDLSEIQQNKTSEAKKKDPQPSGHRCI